MAQRRHSLSASVSAEMPFSCSLDSLVISSSTLATTLPVVPSYPLIAAPRHTEQGHNEEGVAEQQNNGQESGKIDKFGLHFCPTKRTYE